MRRLARAMLLAVLVLAVSWFVARLPGQVTIQVDTVTAEMSAPVAIGALVLMLAAAWTGSRIMGTIGGFPAMLRRRSLARRRRLGDAAVTQALLALAAGKPAEAQREAGYARQFLGDTPQTLLLAAEAARLGGRDQQATATFAALAAREDAGFLGLRGLLRQAIARADWAGAAELARDAEQASPGAVWVRAERTRLAIRAGDWTGALALATSTATRAALSVAAAESARDLARGLLLARQAFEADPTLPPAAIAYAVRLRQRGREGRAQAVLGQGWMANPHPEIAACALEPTADRLARVHVARRLTEAVPQHSETQFLLARVFADAGLTGEARKHADAAHAIGMNQRRLWLLLAEIEERERGDTEVGRLAQRDALKRAAIADPDPVWRCQSCGASALAWATVCAACGEPGGLAWRNEARRAALAGP